MAAFVILGYLLRHQLDRKPVADTVTSRFALGFSQTKAVVYCVGAKLDDSEMPVTYSNLEATNFAALYAITGPGDDFAEAFASDVHGVRLGRPWRVTIERNRKVAKVIDVLESTAL